jgi:F-box-like
MNTILSTKSFDLLPNELLHLVLAQLLFVDYDMFSHRSPVHFLARRAEATSLSLVCHRWRRVAVPVIYESVILTSKSEAKTLVSMLRRVGPYIKKLRIEGGYGHSIHIILSKIPGLAFICVSLNIPSKQKAGGLCSGLKFINPKHVVLRDSQVLGNQGVSNVIDVLIECMTSVWSNLVGVPLES